MLLRCPYCSFKGKPEKWRMHTAKILGIKLSAVVNHPVYVCPGCNEHIDVSKIPKLGKLADN